LCAFSWIFQNYILGYLARVVLYKTGQTKAEEVDPPNARIQLKARDSRGTEEKTKAKFTVNKWRKRKKIDTGFGKGEQGNSDIYYIEKSVLAENKSRVKFRRNFIRDSSCVFSIFSPVRITMTSFPALTLSFVQKKNSCPYNEKKITRWLEDINIIISW